MVPTGKERPKLREPVKRELLVKSGNYCAYPNCSKSLLRPDGAWVGEYAHIEAESPGGPRFNPNLTDDERHSAENLLLMCRNHHRVIDANHLEWTVDRLQQLKAGHERLHAAQRERVSSAVENITRGTLWVPPERVDIFYPQDSRTAEEIQREIVAVESLAMALAQVPRKARSVLALVVALGASSLWGRFEVAVDFDVLCEHVRIPRADVVRQLKVLEHSGFGRLTDSDGIDPALAQVEGSSKYAGWAFFAGLNELNERDLSISDRETVIERVIVGLDFTALDI